jgi:hypothetical protein
MQIMVPACLEKVLEDKGGNSNGSWEKMKRLKAHQNKERVMRRGHIGREGRGGNG